MLLEKASLRCSKEVKQLRGEFRDPGQVSRNMRQSVSQPPAPSCLTHKVLNTSRFKYFTPQASMMSALKKYQVLKFSWVFLNINVLCFTF